MLSILIPVYNYDITSLVSILIYQLKNESVDFEIIVADDCSTDKFIFQKNKTFLIEENNIFFIPLTKNIGRSAIRNLLAVKANYDNLLFLDADVIPKYETFISSYLKFLNTDYDIIYGGIVYDETKPDNNQILRWKYGKERESVDLNERKKKPYINFLTLNFLIKKSVSQVLKFNEEIPNLRCEDTLFSLEAKNKKIRVDHIDNVTIHLGLETNEIFLRKSLESIEVRQSFIKDAILETDYTKITWLASRIKKMKIGFIFPPFFRMTKKFFEKNILSGTPSMLYFDLYRLGYYFYYEKITLKTN